MYDEIKNMSYYLCKNILKNNPLEKYKHLLKDQLIEDPENIDGLKINKSILLMGLNPGSRDLDKKSEKNNCFLKYIFEGPNDSIDYKNFVKRCVNNGYIYPGYYKPNYNLFRNFNVNFLWQNEEYLKRYYKLLGNKELEFLKSFKPKSSNYIIFSDVTFIKETSSNYINKIIDKQLDVSNDIIKLFNMQLSYYKPSLIVVTNAFASHFILNRVCKMKETNDITQVKYKNIPIIFSSMVSGKRQLDKFNYARLKKEINEYVDIFI